VGAQPSRGAGIGRAVLGDLHARTGYTTIGLFGNR
jgi:hypothetical protein